VEIEGVIEMFRTEILAGSFNVAAVFADETGCDWAYSVGLDRNFQHPELLLVGLDASLAGAVIEVLGKQVSGGRLLMPGDNVQIEGCICLQVREVDLLWLARSEVFELGRAVMGSWGERWPETLQLVQADTRGGFPTVAGALGCSPRQSVLMLN